MSIIDYNMKVPQLKKNMYNCFIRKISPEYPDDILKYYIYDFNKENEKNLELIKPTFYFRYKYKHL